MSDNWIIPCNVKYFDIIAHFKEHDEVVWKNSFTIRKGDTAYIYLSAPFGEIRYKCLVISDEIDDETLAANSYAIPKKESHNYFSKKLKYIKMKLEYEFPEGSLTRTSMMQYGLGQVQIQARTDRRLQKYIDSVYEEKRQEVISSGS